MAATRRGWIFLLATLLVAGCGWTAPRAERDGGSGTPRPAATATATASSSVEGTPEATATRRPTASPTPRPSPTEEPTPDVSFRPLPTGYARITVIDAGLSIGLPSTWTAIRSDRADEIEAVIAEADNPFAASVLKSSAEGVRSGEYLVVAADRKSTTSKPAAAMVSMENAVPASSRSAFLKSVTAELKKQYPQITVSSKLLTLPGGPAIMLTYSMRMPSVGVSVTLKAAHYMVFAPEHLYQVILITTSAGYAGYTPTFTKIANTLQPFA